MRFAGGGPEATQPGHHRPSMGAVGEDVAGSSDSVVAVGVAKEGVGEGAAEVALAKVVSGAVEAVGRSDGVCSWQWRARKATTAIPLGMLCAEMSCHAARHTVASTPAGGGGGWAGGWGRCAGGRVCRRGFARGCCRRGGRSQSGGNRLAERSGDPTSGSKSCCKSNRRGGGRGAGGDGDTDGEAAGERHAWGARVGDIPGEVDEVPP